MNVSTASLSDRREVGPNKAVGIKVLKLALSSRLDSCLGRFSAPFNYPQVIFITILNPILISASLESPLHIIILPGGGSDVLFIYPPRCRVLCQQLFFITF